MHGLIAEPSVVYGPGVRPAFALAGGDAAGRDALAVAVLRTGGRIAASMTLDEAARTPRGGAMLLVDAVQDAGDPLDRMLGELDAAAARGRPGLVVASIGTVDVVMRRIADPGVTVLVDPNATLLESAIAAMGARAAAVHEDSETDAARLAELREEVSRIARQLASIAVPPAPEAAGSQDEAGPASTDRAMVRAILRLRRLRDQHFAPQLFADPAWDILLDLAAARSERRTVAVSSLCIAAAVPPTTALRWITTMTDQDLLARRSDPRDGRRAFVAMSDGTAAAMSAYLAAARRVMLPVA